VPVPRRWLRELAGGWSYVGAHRDLHLLFWNAMLFGGCIAAAAPLITVLMLRDLGLRPWQYGLALGLPGLGGVLGSLTVIPLTRRLRLSTRTVLLVFGTTRTVWLGLIPLAPPGSGGLILIIIADTLLAAATSTRTAITVAALALLASAALLPWRGGDLRRRASQRGTRCS
jgi:hypothetical protein